MTKSQNVEMVETSIDDDLPCLIVTGDNMGSYHNHFFTVLRYSHFDITTNTSEHIAKVLFRISANHGSHHPIWFDSDWFDLDWNFLPNNACYAITLFQDDGYFKLFVDASDFAVYGSAYPSSSTNQSIPFHTVNGEFEIETTAIDAIII